LNDGFPTAPKQTTWFEFTIGVNKGYKHKNDCEDPLGYVIAAWQATAEKVAEEDGCYVSAVFRQAKVLYRDCPPGGEDVVIVTGHLNKVKLRTTTSAKWGGSVRATCELVQQLLKQTTATLIMGDGDLYYSRIDYK
jgi:hypothetical protein